MGGGAWTSTAYCNYTVATKAMNAREYASCDSINVQQAFKMREIHPDLNPMNVMRSCRDTEEHPKTVPVILALDVTGSMGKAATEVSKKLGPIMEDIYEHSSVSDVEFCIMAIGDLYCDAAPIQISQFESDVRIAEHLDKVWFEGGGGGNAYESYTTAWYMGLNHCDLDCWKRGKKGVIITMGDEQINPYLQQRELGLRVGDKLQADIETRTLFEEASEKFDIHHISVDDPESSYSRYNRNGGIDASWKPVLGDNYHVSTISGLQQMISGIITGHAGDSMPEEAPSEIRW